MTVIGNISSPTPGEILSMSGEWTNHPKFGEQFKVVFCTCTVPASIAGIQKERFYLHLKEIEDQNEEDSAFKIWDEKRIYPLPANL